MRAPYSSSRPHYFRRSHPTVERLEAKQLLSFDPSSAIPANVQYSLASEGSAPSPPGFPSTTFVGPVAEGEKIRPYSSAPSFAAMPAASMISVKDMASGSGSGGYSSGSDSYGSGGDSSGSSSGTGDGGTGGDHGSSGSYYSWSSESSGTSESSGSGADGYGGTKTWDDLWSWDDTWTWDSDGNSSWTSHSEHHYTYTDSGTTSGGDTYSVQDNENDHSDGSGYSHSDGTSHSGGSSGEDSLSTDNESNSLTTLVESDSYHSTGQSHSDTNSSGTTNGSSSDSHGEADYSLTLTDGLDTVTTTAVGHTTDHSDRTSSLSPYGWLLSSTSNTTHDDDGQDNNTTHLAIGADTDDSGYFDEYTDHSESHGTSNGTSGTYTASSHSDDDGKSHQDISLSDGSNTDDYGSTSNYKGHEDSSTAASGISTSNWSQGDGGSSYETISYTDPMGGVGDEGYFDEFKNQSQGGSDATGASTSTFTDTEDGHDYADLTLPNGSDIVGEHSSDHYNFTDQGGMNADGTTYGSYTASGGGSFAFSSSVTAGDNYLNVGDHSTSTYTASGGVNPNGSTYGTFNSDDSGGDDASVQVDDGSGDVYDDGGSETFDEQDNNGTITETSSGSNIVSGVLSSFVLGKYGAGWSIISDAQTQIHIETTDGDVYDPATATDLINLLKMLDSQGDLISFMYIKGHADGTGISVGDGDEFLTVPPPAGALGTLIYVGGEDVTNMLLSLTNNRTQIELRGCWTGDLAARLQGALDGAKVSGSMFWVIGIPWTGHTFGPYN